MAVTFTMDSEQIGREIDVWNEKARKEYPSVWVQLDDVYHFELDGRFGLDELEGLVRQLKELRMRWGQQGNKD